MVMVVVAIAPVMAVAEGRASMVCEERVGQDAAAGERMWWKNAAEERGGGPKSQREAEHEGGDTAGHAACAGSAT